MDWRILRELTERRGMGVSGQELWVRCRPAPAHDLAGSRMELEAGGGAVAVLRCRRDRCSWCVPGVSRIAAGTSWWCVPGARSKLPAVDVLCCVSRDCRNGCCSWLAVCPWRELQTIGGVSPGPPVARPRKSVVCPQALPHGVVSLRLLRDVPVFGIGTMLRVLSVRQNFRAGVLVALLPCPCAGSGGVTDGVIRRGFGRCCAAVIDVVVCPQGMLELGGGVSPEELWCVPNACWS